MVCSLRLRGKKVVGEPKQHFSLSPTSKEQQNNSMPRTLKELEYGYRSMQIFIVFNSLHGQWSGSIYPSSLALCLTKTS